MIKKVKLLFKNYQQELIFLLVVFMVLNLSLEMPYLNLILSTPLSILILVVLSIFLFQLSSQFLMKTILTLFFICFILLLIGRGQEADKLGSLIYGVFFIIVAKELVSFFKT